MSFQDPPREFTLLPLWFWNDDLREAELIRQIDDFEKHGVYGFCIHPRVGLPRDIGWMSDRMLHFMRVAIEEAKRRGMYVVLFDEGMYPSGSSSGQVVAENPAWASRGLAKVDLQPGQTAPDLGEDQHLIAIIDRPDGGKAAVIDRKAGGYIRGLHYIGDGPEEDEPPAADILNPDAVDSFIRHVYQKLYDAFKADFGTTILGIFTDEPGIMGKMHERRVRPGSRFQLPHVNRILGYDFTPHLATLWYEAAPDAAKHRKAYDWAIHHRLQEVYFAAIRKWVETHPGAALCGHPRWPDDIGPQRFFDIPGQDLVWRQVVPHHPSALETRDSTQAKCASSAMIHLGRRRNGNECYGAYGHELTYEETKWLADWLFVRGCNLLYPHAFYYSIRGVRVDERPPDVGPNSKWWPTYKTFADYCRRMCWLNTDSRHVCDVAILGEENHLPWRAAKALFQNQIDFNYLEMRHLWEDARASSDGIRIAGMHYRVLILDGELSIDPRAKTALDTLAKSGRLITYTADDELLTDVDRQITRDVLLSPGHTDLRVRHVIKDGQHYYMICNEGSEPVSTTAIGTSVTGTRTWLDPLTGEQHPTAGNGPLVLPPYTMQVLQIMPR